MKKLLSKEIVEQAIIDIKAAGDKPTIERIRKITGGSPKTIIEIKRLINDSESDSNNDNKLSLNDNEHNSSYGSRLSLNDIDNHINHQLEQRFEQVKTELLSEFKKNSSSESNEVEKLQQQIATLETQNKQLKRDLLAVKNEVSNDLDELKLKRKQVEKFKADNADLNQQVERLQADYDKQEKELKVALDTVDSLASENVELRSSLESVEPNQPEPQVEPVDTTEPEKELVINPTTKERCFELFEYGHRQKDILKILDSEGLKNAAGKKIGGGTVSKWYARWKKDN